ncbi:hypothetical protein [Streptomyces sp. CRN 30]|uniref:hypothetical protein n=1 Tax=Streptomyces sp. CRN 30 TaxID=3075613 RepID=UPI002A838EC0|nr:hypothetical protein [Streptomyces sp. CRN 30]
MRPRRRGRGTALTAFTATAATLALSWAPVAQAAPPPTAAPTAAATARPDAAPPPDACTLGDEGARCLDVDARLDHAPATGGDATLTVTLRTSAELDDVAVRVELPSTLAWRTAPDGFTEERAASDRPEAYGAVNAAERVLDVEAGRKMTFRSTVTALRAAPTSIRVQAVSPDGEPYSSWPEIVPLTVGNTGEKSFLGYGEGPFRTKAVPSDAVPAKKKPRSATAGENGLPEPHTDEARNPGVQATSCVQGSWAYMIGDVVHPSSNFEVQVWDEDGLFDDLLAVGITDGSGAYDICFENDDGVFGGGVDLYVKFVAFNQSWSVRDDDDDPYEFQFETRGNVADGATVNYGRRMPSDPNLFRALRVFDYADEAAVWTPGRCWDRDDTDCFHIGILWPTDDPSAFYDPDDDRVHLPDDRAEQPWVVDHEIGHGVMDDVYGGYQPDIGEACFDHQVGGEESPECAWVEGFADFYGTMVVDLFGHDEPFDFRTPTWGDPADWDNGPNVEGRIAGALIDLIDDDDELYWDDFAEGEANVWETFLDHRSDHFQQYWQQRTADGYDVGDGPMSALYQNTIDMGFRDPLTSGAEKTRPSPNPPGHHNYRYDTKFRFWSVVAVRAGTGTDYDLELYDDRNMTQKLGDSLSGVGFTDFVAVDSNVDNRELGDYYPRVTHRVGGGEYTVEVSDTGKILPLTGDSRTMGADDVVEVWDTCTDTPQTITVTPSDAGQDAELYLVDSDPGAGTSSVKGRQDILTGSVTGDPGEPETVTLTPSGLDCYGVVLINRAGSGTYSLSVS